MKGKRKLPLQELFYDLFNHLFSFYIIKLMGVILSGLETVKDLVETIENC